MQRGFTLIEVLLAVGMAAIFMGAMVSLVLVGDRTATSAMQTQRATWVAQEGIAALRSMAFEDLLLTESGGLLFTVDQWSLVASPDQPAEGFTRSVDVREVRRNASCEIVQAPDGDIDPDSRQMIVTVDWVTPSQVSRQVTFDSLRTHWQNPEGSCFLPEVANQVTVDVSEADLFGGKQLREVYITNNGSQSIVIDKVTYWWNNGALIQQVFIGGSKVWSSSGPGTPLGDQSTGTVLDVEDRIILAGETVEMEKTQFLSNMDGEEFILKIEFDDGSSITTDSFLPD